MIFKYKAYNNLLTELGRIDSVIEITELAVRDFLKRLYETTPPENFLKLKGEEHGIMVSLNKPKEYYYQVILGYISNVYHLAETFLYEMQSEYNEICNPNPEDSKWIFQQGKTKLFQTINFLVTKNRINQTDLIPTFLIDTFDYYHQLRVYFSHKKTTSLGEVKNKYEKAISHYQTDTLLKRYRISAGPNEIHDLTFEDFFLFTQVSKDLALFISSFGYPDPASLAKMPCLKKLNRYKEKIPRIESYLKTEFGFIKENDSDILAEQILQYM